jgi:hypothetical protein
MLIKGNTLAKLLNISHLRQAKQIQLQHIVLSIFCKVRKFLKVLAGHCGHQLAPNITTVYLLFKSESFFG